MKNNHNFVTEGFIAHNMMIVIKTSEGKKFEIDFSP